MKRNQQGITLLGFVMVLALVGFFLFIGMKLFPVYSEYYSARSDIDAVAAEPGMGAKSVEQVREALNRRFYISYVESIDLKKNVKIVRNGQVSTLVVEYEVRRPLIQNLDFVAKFSHSAVLSK